VSESSDKGNRNSDGGPPAAAERDSPRGAMAPLVATLTVVGVLIFVFMKSSTPTPPPPTPVVGTPTTNLSQYPLCRELGELYAARNAELRCLSDGFSVPKVLCEQAFVAKRDCIEMLQAGVACLKTQPTSAWHCEASGNLVFEAPACATVMLAVSRCFSR
jgi:hypothetical protein